MSARNSENEENEKIEENNEKEENENEIESNINRQQIILLVGPPSCGKSTLCSKHFNNSNFVRVNMDELKTRAKCIKAAKDALILGKSVVIDNTNSTKQNRNDFIKAALETKKPIFIRCIVFDVKKDLALHLNMLRVKMTKGKTKKLPEVSYNVFYKNYQEPTLDEGIEDIMKIPFQVDFKDELHKKLFLERN